MALLSGATIRLLVLGLLATGLAVSPAPGQEVRLPSLKAAFLANFVKFAVWPPDAMPAGRVFTYCVVGDKQVTDALLQVVKTHPAGEPENVISIAADGDLRACQMLYVAGLDARQLRHVIDSLQGAAVFTASDVQGFAELGGVAQLKLVDGQMRFAINPAAAQRARIALSGRLLSLATLVKDGGE